MEARLRNNAILLPWSVSMLHGLGAALRSHNMHHAKAFPCELVTGEPQDGAAASALFRC